MEKSKIIDYKGSQFVVGLEWREFSAPKSKIIKNKIRSAVTRYKYDGFGVRIVVDKTKEQLGFSNKKNKGTVSLAKLFASQEDFKNSLVILKLDNKEYWTVSITEDSMIVTGQDAFYNEEDFVETIGDFLQIEGDNVNVFIAEDNLEEIENLLIDYAEDIEFKTFDTDLVFSGSQKTNEIEMVYNSSIDNLKQLGMLSATVVLSAVGYLYVYQESDQYYKITEQEISQNFLMQYSKFLKDAKKGNKPVDTASLIDNAKKELIDIHTTTYSNEEIIIYMNKLFGDFPLYLVEWELVDLVFLNDGNNETFRMSYKRIPNSYGYKSQFEEEILKILKDSRYSKYNISYPDTKGDLAFLTFSFKDKVRPETLVEKEDSKNKKKKKAKKSTTEDYKQKLTKIRKNIENIESSVYDFGFVDKRFGSALDEKEDEIRREVNKSNKIFKEIKQNNKKSKVKENDDFDYSIIDGSRSDMLSMMQKYSYYSWKENSTAINYPKVKRSNRGSSNVSFAKSYEFAVSVGSNIDVIGLKGLKDILLNDSLLNKPYIKISEITFNLNSEVWSIKGETYEKI